MKNYYEILKIKSTASLDDIRAAYFALAKTCHPDTHNNDKKKIAQFNEITEAFEFLQNPINRMGLDSELHVLEQKKKKREEESLKEDFFKRMKDSGFDIKKNESFIKTLCEQIDVYESIIISLLDKTNLSTQEKLKYLSTIRKNKSKRVKN